MGLVTCVTSFSTIPNVLLLARYTVARSVSHGVYDRAQHFFDEGKGGVVRLTCMNNIHVGTVDLQTANSSVRI